MSLRLHHLFLPVCGILLALVAEAATAADDGLVIRRGETGIRATLQGERREVPVRRLRPPDPAPEPDSLEGGPDSLPPSVGGDPRSWYAPGELLVGDPPDGFRAAAKGLGFTVLGRRELGNLGLTIVHLRAPAGVSVPQARRRLLDRFPGIVVDANHYYDTQADAAARRFHARALLGWPAAPEGCGAGLRLGMIDAPVDVDHPALKGQRVTYRSFHNRDRTTGSAEHGTAIAAMLVGRRGWGGLLPEADLKAANMFEVTDDGRTVGNAKALLKALDWLAGARVEVVNLSVAGGDNRLLRYAFGLARRQGLVMVAAVGNWGRADRPAAPAAYEQTIAVTAVDAERRLYKHANRGSYVEFAAPGVGVWTAVPGGGKYQSGTSFAVPYLTAALALARHRGLPHDVTAARRFLRKLTVDLGDTGRDPAFGWGYVDTRPFCAE